MASLATHHQVAEGREGDAADSDAALVQRAQTDRAAFEPLYLKYVNDIGRYCQSQLGDAEISRDVTQQVFLQALNGLPSYRERGSFRGWLYQIARNVITDERRRRPALSLDLDGGFDAKVATEDGPDDLVEQTLTREMLLAAMQRLPDDQRYAMELRLAGLTGPEMAAVMNRSHDAVRALQARAFSQLRVTLGEHTGQEASRG